MLIFSTASLAEASTFFLPIPTSSNNVLIASLTTGYAGITDRFPNPHYVGDLVQNRSTTVSMTSKKRKKVES